MAATRVHLIVTGRVQGVAYRASALAEGRRLGVSGWVRNRFDGSVEAEVEGPAEDVDAFVAWARHGPPGARVAEVQVSSEAPTGLASGFHMGTTG